ncbi:MAG: FAD-binding oxidoreductase [Actinobacteria bacterium]|nr:FAD-binding oxidoreductase [Actinomycetota bacterium]
MGHSSESTVRPARDQAPDSLAHGVAQPLRGDLEALLGADRVLSRPSDIVRYASDASPYRMLPSAVVVARDADDVARVLAFGRERGIPVVFRGGGTSLNGQGQTEGILVDVRRHFRGLTVEEDGAALRVGAGTILGHANKVLAPYRRRLGPDPASTDIATVGGVVANNSGGMRCGVTADSYSTLRSLSFVLPSGTRIDTAAPGAAATFEAAEPELTAGLAAIRDEIREDAELAARIRRKFEIKNTTGYRLCAFLDAEEPLEIFRRLLVGSEGTLAHISEVVFDTVPQPPLTTTAWVHFPSVDAAIGPVSDLVGTGATAVELMIAPALVNASANIQGAPPEWKDLPPDSAALLVEFGATDEADLDLQVGRAMKLLGAEETIRSIEFTRDPETVEMHWRVREGLHGLIGRERPAGSALIAEDICLRPDQIAAAGRDLQMLQAKHGFQAGFAGHASAGNLHFLLTPDFAKPEDVDRYESFMEGLVDLIVDKYDGSLKAEHGTGINMAPFVEREWGPKATQLMWRIKELADPDGVLGPGVILSRDPGAHLRNLKSTPPIEESATACVECGFCEPVCPSRNLTVTPRQRIVLRREIMRQPEDSPLRRALEREFDYDGLDTCAADGSCQIVCPLGIDTGKLVKELRSRKHSALAENAATIASRHWGSVEKLSRAGLKASRPLARGTKRGAALPRPSTGKLPATNRAGAAAVYVPSCTNRIFGGGPAEALVAVSARAGLPVWIPEDIAGSCCGLPWGSKGLDAAHREKAAEMVELLWRWSARGTLPVIIDAASCTGAITDPGEAALDAAATARLADLEVHDSVAWAHDQLLPSLTVTGKLGRVAVHPTCATRRLGHSHRLSTLAEALADEVFVPPSAFCCGFAGDRGFTRPELTSAATAEEAAELSAARSEGKEFEAYISANRTCEIGLERATGQSYESVLIVLERLTRPRPTPGPN